MEIPLCKDAVLEWNGSDLSGPPMTILMKLELLLGLPLPGLVT